jgi:hypothetical protein
MSSISRVLAPGIKLVNRAVELTFRPRQFTYQHVASGSFEGWSVLLTSITFSFVLLNTGMFALGLEGYREVYYWVWTVPVLFLFLACVTLGVQLGGLVAPVRIVHAFLYPYAVNLFVGALLFAVSALTIRLLLATGVIHTLHVDDGSRANFSIVLGNLYVECLARANLLIAVARNLSDQHHYLAPPFSYLPLMRSIVVVFYTAIFALILAAALRRSRWAMLVVVAVSGSVVVAANLTSSAYFHQRYIANPEPTCAAQAYDQALEKTGSSRIQEFIERGKLRERFMAIANFMVTDVRAEGEALVIYWTVDTSKVDNGALGKSAAETRERLQLSYCLGDYSLVSGIGGSIVSVYRSIEGNHLQTWAIGPHDCKR